MSGIKTIAAICCMMSAFHVPMCYGRGQPKFTGSIWHYEVSANETIISPTSNYFRMDDNRELELVRGSIKRLLQVTVTRPYGQVTIYSPQLMLKEENGKAKFVIERNLELALDDVLDMLSLKTKELELTCFLVDGSYDDYLVIVLTDQGKGLYVTKQGANWGFQLVDASAIQLTPVR